MGGHEAYKDIVESLQKEFDMRDISKEVYSGLGAGLIGSPSCGLLWPFVGW